MRLPLTNRGLARRANQDDLARRLELEFDKRALLPRLVVLAVLLVGALLDNDSDHGLSHWIVLATYGVTTFAITAVARLPSARPFLPWIGTGIDAAVAVYILVEHLPRNVHDAHHATDALSLLPALLFLLQTGLRLRASLVMFFAGLVLAGWALSFGLILGSPADLLSTEEGSDLTRRQVQGIAAFIAAAFFVLSAVFWMRRTAATAWREREDRLLISRFLPEGIAGNVVRGGDTIEIAERHACLLSVDIRGSSTMARDYPASRTVSWLLTFRRIVSEAVSRRGGIVDKYLGDGVLALFLQDEPESQAEDALFAACAVVIHLQALNVDRASRGEPPLRTIISLHCGRVLAGVFDDGHRAEFTVLGPPMNALPRIERHAKEAEVDVVASLDFVRTLPSSARDLVGIEPLPPDSDPELPDLAVLRLQSLSSSITTTPLSSGIIAQSMS